MGAARVFSIVAMFATIIIVLGWVQAPPQPQHQVASSVVFGTASIVDPTAYSSDSQAFQLSVNPTDRYGRAGAFYEMKRNGDQIWAQDLPYTLLDVVVTDSGEVVGYSYSQGVEGFGSAKGPAGDGFADGLTIPDGSRFLTPPSIRESQNESFSSVDFASKIGCDDQVE